MTNLYAASIDGSNGNRYFLNTRRDIQKDIQFLAKEEEEYKTPVVPLTSPAEFNHVFEIEKHAVIDDPNIPTQKEIQLIGRHLGQVV